MHNEDMVYRNASLVPQCSSSVIVSQDCVLFPGEEKTVTQQLDEIFYPRSIAIVGASDGPRKMSYWLPFRLAGDHRAGGSSPSRGASLFERVRVGAWPLFFFS